MNWIPLTTLGQFDEIKQSSEPVLVFKHSTRCPVSSMAKRNFELESVLLPESLPTYYLDLIMYRDVSNFIAESLNVRHESPQVLLIHNQECIFHASHNDISVADVVGKLTRLSS